MQQAQRQVHPRRHSRGTRSLSIAACQQPEALHRMARLPPTLSLSYTPSCTTNLRHSEQQRYAAACTEEHPFGLAHSQRHIVTTHPVFILLALTGAKVVTLVYISQHAIPAATMCVGSLAAAPPDGFAASGHTMSRHASVSPDPRCAHMHTSQPSFAQGGLQTSSRPASPAQGCMRRAAGAVHPVQPVLRNTHTRCSADEHCISTSLSSNKRTAVIKHASCG